MKKITITVLMLLISSCALCEKSAGLSETKEPTVEVIIDNGETGPGILIYTPQAIDDLVFEGDVPPQEICEFRTIEYAIEPFEVSKAVVGNVYSTVEKDLTRPTPYWLREEARRSDYMFISDNTIYIAAGSKIDFINWVVVSIDNQNILWSENFEGYETKMNFDGTIDQRTRLMITPVNFHIEGRGKSPALKTFIGLNVNFLVLENCEEAEL